jgi:hypothetical protein
MKMNMNMNSKCVPVKNKNLGIRFYVFLVFITLVLTVSSISCKKSKNTQPVDIYIDVNALIESEPEIVQTQKISAGVYNWNLRENELFASERDENQKEFLIDILDIDTLNKKRTLHLPAGDRQSPTCFYSPNHIEYIDGRYYVIDQHDKFVVYDRDFHFLYASMYHQSRYFIDFFKWDNRVMFVIGTWVPTMKFYGCEIKLFELPEGKKPVYIDTLNRIELNRIPNRSKSSRYSYKMTIAQSMYGFEKDGKIYYNAPSENVFMVYDLKTRKTMKIELSYLKPKKFTDDQASKFAYRFGEGFEEYFKTKLGFEMVYQACPDPQYYFGLYDIGKDKIGIVGDLDVDLKMKYRLDIIDCKTYQYIESIWFPIGSEFYHSITEQNHGGSINFIDPDKGLFIWGDREGEDRDYITRISRLKIKDPLTGEKIKQ